MDLIRKIFDSSYHMFKPFLFSATKKDPEKAHDWFILFSQLLAVTKLEKFVLDNKADYNKLPFEISNGAGLDKNGEISPQFFRYFGLEPVYGTVTGEKNIGNPRPRTKRIAKRNSFINDIAWENDGAKIISNRLKRYKNYEIPIRISIGITPIPNMSTEQKLNDLRKTLNSFKGIHCIVGYEYNPSCGNLCISREENQRFSGEAVRFIKPRLGLWQELDIKISPDLTDKEIDRSIKDTYDFVDGYVTTNATTQHNFGIGSASGDIVYAPSLRMQKKVYERLKGTDKNITACGGINSRERALERIEFEPQEDKRIQTLTGLLYGGPGFITDLKSGKFYKNGPEDN